MQVSSWISLSPHPKLNPSLRPAHYLTFYICPESISNPLQPQLSLPAPQVKELQPPSTQTPKLLLAFTENPQSLT